MQRGRAVLLGGVDDRDADDEQDAIAAKIAQPCRRLPTMRPYVAVSPAGISRISSISRKFESPVGFSNGSAELTLKKPPPLVPSSLIASCEATGPRASVGRRRRASDVDVAAKVWITPCETSTSAATTQIGSST